MLWRTHFLAGTAAGLLLAGHVDIKTMAVSAGVAGISALMPDLDDPHSKLGRLVAPASWTVKVTLGHRGPLHSLVGVGIAFVLASVFLRSGYTYLIPMVVAGYLSHLAMDSLNPQGVPWLWPVKTHFRVPLVQTGSILERLIITPAMLVLCVWLFWSSRVVK
ncbi:MAG: metal-dependent hydrolase [Peptococcaceae bacterium]|nr:metal-dependent hydrolase [Peptococcaceae bacterium]